VYVVQPDGRIHRERMELRFMRRFVEDIDPSKERLDFEGPENLDRVLDELRDMRDYG
jgi:hypothetical protein